MSGVRWNEMTSGSVTVRCAERDDLGRLAQWLCRVCSDPESQCLHSWSGESTDALRERLAGYLDDSELQYLLLERPGELSGAMGAEYDTSLGRAWLHGPHVLLDDWGGNAERLFHDLVAMLPTEVEHLTAYVNTRNSRARAFFGAHGFSERDTESHEFWLVPSKDRGSVEGRAVDLRSEHRDSFSALYESLFPAAYYSSDRVVEMIGRSHHVVVVADGSDVLGFAVSASEVEGSLGEVQFLGVREDCRRRGLGRELLQSAVNWLVDVAHAPRVSLNVDADLGTARDLYESVGFRLRFSGIGLGRSRY